MKVDPEDFDRWKAHPVTEALMKACGVWAEQAKALWLNASWEGGVNKDTDLWRLRGQAEALRDMQQLTAEQLEETLNGQA